MHHILDSMEQYDFLMMKLWYRRREADSSGVALSSPPFGYRHLAAGYLGEDSAEQLALRRARDLRAQRASFHQVIATLRAEGQEPKRGNVWYLMPIRQQLHPGEEGPSSLAAEHATMSARARLKAAPNSRFRSTGALKGPNGAA